MINSCNGVDLVCDVVLILFPWIRYQKLGMETSTNGQLPIPFIARKHNVLLNWPKLVVKLHQKAKVELKIKVRGKQSLLKVQS